MLDERTRVMIADYDEIRDVVMWPFEEKLEIKFLNDKLFKSEGDVYVVKDIGTYKSLDMMNSVIYKYEKAILVKPFLSHPFNLRCFLICSGKRKSIAPEYISSSNNHVKVLKFVSGLIGYAEVWRSMLMKKNRENKSEIGNRENKSENKSEIMNENKSENSNPNENLTAISSESDIFFNEKYRIASMFDAALRELYHTDQKKLL